MTCLSNWIESQLALILALPLSSGLQHSSISDSTSHCCLHCIIICLKPLQLACPSQNSKLIPSPSLPPHMIYSPSVGYQIKKLVWPKLKRLATYNTNKHHTQFYTVYFFHKKQIQLYSNDKAKVQYDKPEMCYQKLAHLYRSSEDKILCPCKLQFCTFYQYCCLVSSNLRTIPIASHPQKVQFLKIT